jgi:predicted  nucleic acid-binding Zn-ribbon protein
MIETKFIESANEIRKEYLRLSDELSKKEEILTEFKGYISSKIDDLNDFKEINLRQNKPQNKDDLMRVANELIGKMSEIEEKEKSLNKRIQDIDEKMTKLQKEENELLKSIRKRYPEMSIEEIKKEIHSRISH